MPSVHPPCAGSGVFLPWGSRLTQCWSFSLGLPWAWPVSRMLLWFCLMTAALTLAILAVFLLQPLAHPCVALLTQLLWGCEQGNSASPDNAPLSPNKAQSWVSSLGLAHGVASQMVLLRQLSRWDACRAQREGANHYTGIA